MTSRTTDVRKKLYKNQDKDTEVSFMVGFHDPMFVRVSPVDMSVSLIV